MQFMWQVKWYVLSWLPWIHLVHHLFSLLYELFVILLFWSSKGTDSTGEVQVIGGDSLEKLRGKVNHMTWTAVMWSLTFYSFLFRQCVLVVEVGCLSIPSPPTHHHQLLPLGYCGHWSHYGQAAESLEAIRAKECSCGQVCGCGVG